MHDVHAMQNNSAPVTKMNGILVDSTNHMTLYTYDKDDLNKSNCGKVCLVAWPAFLAPKASTTTGKLTTIKRDDGKYQWAMNAAVVQLVRISACHAEGRGFESRPLRHISFSMVKVKYTLGSAWMIVAAFCLP